MTGTRALALALTVGAAVSGCATLRTFDADLDHKPHGVRVYPPRVYLLVDADRQRSHLVQLPDFRRAYDILPVAVLAKHDFEVELDGGILQTLTSKQDPTAFLDLAGRGGELGAAAAGVAVSKETVDGTFGLPSGIYVLEDDGIFHALPAAGSN